MSVVPCRSREGREAWEGHMGIFDYLLAIAIGIFAQMVRGRNGFLWGGLTLGMMTLGEFYQIASIPAHVWVILVSIVVVLILVSIKPKF
jgi:hypothetical protein